MRTALSAATGNTAPFCNHASENGRVASVMAGRPAPPATRSPLRHRLLFQPAYHPWVNRIERLWKAMHDTVTRNRRYATMDELLATVRGFVRACQPFPGNQHGLAKAEV